MDIHLYLPKKFELLPANHPTVIRRLVKELNYRPAGFYVTGSRYNQARFKKGNLEVRMGRDKWVIISSDEYIGDGSGGRIMASRTRCGY
jgi:hypothetical protein